MKYQIVTNLTHLRLKSELVMPEEVASIVHDLNDSLDLKLGCGLTAVQIGIYKQVSIIKFRKIDIVLINPVILEKIERYRFLGESCLSLPGLKMDTARYSEITILNNGERTLQFDGMEAAIVQHEIDHMQGVTILDRKWRRRG